MWWSMAIPYKFFYARVSTLIVLKTELNLGLSMMMIAKSVEGETSRRDERYLLRADVKWRRNTPIFAFSHRLRTLTAPFSRT